MKTMKAPNLYQLTFLPGIFPVNCYLVEDEKELILIDAALPYSVKGILSAAQKIGKPISKIVLTHPHEDHAGALDAVKKELQHAPVYLSGRDAKWIGGTKELEEGEPSSPIKGRAPKNLKTKPDILIKDGDRIGPLLAVSTPGHTPGHMSFLDTRTGMLIAGDAMQTRGGVAVAGKPQPLFPFPSWGTWHLEKAIESAEKLASLKPEGLAPGHGAILNHPFGKMKTAIAEAREYAAKQKRKGKS
ncbi:MBL fold metallo-hydrolase [Metabacillus sp. GX 13764]|uniref:MBL fold metallo-hydrolase n=1 Tax=Metabacillus kandeliae TaxID=2900151 RepID=UPI001E4D2EE7|nr:MBL fold metallo-hydrolase [Metabacillus kandeliae]MCD7033557.1 MBL fold metallo-hydrolase [Metabacillus kandeliae]